MGHHSKVNTKQKGTIMSWSFFKSPEEKAKEAADFQTFCQWLDESTRKISALIPDAGLSFHIVYEAVCAIVLRLATNSTEGVAPPLFPTVAVETMFGSDSQSPNATAAAFLSAWYLDAMKYMKGVKNEKSRIANSLGNCSDTKHVLMFWSISLYWELAELKRKGTFDKWCKNTITMSLVIANQVHPQ